MNGNESDPVAKLSAADRLILLQLLTREAMQRRHERQLAQSDDEDSPEPMCGVELDAVAVPERWRLVPEGTALHAWQVECLGLWLPQGRGTIKVATGGGKTLFALAAAERLQNEREADLRLVVVVPTIPLMYQWRDELKAGNVPAGAIALLGGGQDAVDLSTTRILICVLNSARVHLPKLVRKAGWARRMMLVVDECHRSNAEQARRIFESKPRYTLGLSATPEQEGDARDLPTDQAYAASPVGQGLGPILYDFSLNQALQARLLTPFEVWHIGLSLSEAEAAEHARLSRQITDLRKPLQVHYHRSGSKQEFIPWCQSLAKRGGAGAAEAERLIGLSNGRKRLLYRASARIEITLQILKGDGDPSVGRCIVFHESIDEIERLFLRALSIGLPAVLEHSQLPAGVRDDNIDAFRTGVARAIISAKSLVEGFNVPSADLGIIAASSGSARQRIQSLGRLLRRKPEGQHARVVVLYVRDTQDESIYQKADWEQVIGAERNRYFHWRQPEIGAPWFTGLTEVDAAPQVYRPPSIEVDITNMACDAEYPGRPDGIDVRVDAAESLRTEDGRLVTAPTAMVQRVLGLNPQRRGHITAAGHLIVRVESGNARQPKWLFLGPLAVPEAADSVDVVRFKLTQSSGTRKIARQEPRGGARYALDAKRASNPDSGRACEQLLAWVRAAEVERGVRANALYWDGQTRYWIEVQGQRIEYPSDLPPLEFVQ